MRFRLLQMLLCVCVLLGFVALLELSERSSTYFDLTPYADTETVRYRAGATIRWGREGYGVTHIGPHGMIAAKPLGDGPRVLFLGDSYTEALQVDDAEKFTEACQSLYNQQFPQQPSTTLNFAVSGQGAAQHAADLPGLARVYRPRIVVAQLSVYDFWPADAKRKIPTQPAFLTEQNGALAIGRKSFNAPANWRQQLMRGRLFSTYARASWRLQNLLRPQAESGSEAAPDAATSTKDEAYFAEYRAITEFLLKQLAQTAQASGAQLTVLYTPKTPLLQNGRIIRDEAEFGAQHTREREILFAACRELGLPVWNPTARLIKYYDETGQFPVGFANTQPGYGHLNPAGHRIVAELLSENLRQLLTNGH